MPRLRLTVTPEAELDIAEAYCWYEEQARLGNAFINAVGERLDQIHAQPLSCSAIAHGIRRAVVHRFPYNVYYTVAGDCLDILTVWQGNRNQASLLAGRLTTKSEQ